MQQPQQTPVRPYPGRLTPWWVRALGYLACAVVVPWTALSAGIAWDEHRNCSGPEFSGECDLSVIAGATWALVAFFVVLVLIPLCEVWLHRA